MIVAAVAFALAAAPACRPAALVAAGALRAQHLHTRVDRVRRWPVPALDPRRHRVYLLSYTLLEPAPPVLPTAGPGHTLFVHVVRRAGGCWRVRSSGTSP